MRPSYELLASPGGGSAQAELRTLARAHPRARLARHSSRSYCGSLALVAWHGAPLGIDLERVQAADPAFAESICTPTELDRFAAQLAEPAFVTSLWSSKEALAKALGDALAYDPRRLESPLNWIGGSAGPWRAWELEPSADHVGWLVWQAGAQNSSASDLSADSTRRLAGRR